MSIEYSKQAKRFLAKQSFIVSSRIIRAIETLPKGDVKKLSGRDGYRLRVGDYRVIFDIYGNVTYIDKIGNRGDIYKS